MSRRGGTTKKTIQYHLGSDRNHTVYKAEVIGLLLATELLRGERWARKISMGIDNQAAILALRVFKSGSGHYLMDCFHNALHDIRHTSNLEDLTIRWMPGHTGIAGNEIADTAAKEAAGGHSFSPELLPPALRYKDRAHVLPKSKSAQKSHFAKRTKQLH